MNNKKYNLKKGCSIFLVLYVVFALFFLYVARYQIRYTKDETVVLSDTTNTNLGALPNGSTVVQEVENGHQYLQGIKAYFSTYGQKNKGTAEVSVLDGESGQVLGTKTIHLDGLTDNEWETIKFDQMLDLEAYIKKTIRIAVTVHYETEDAMITMGADNAPTDGAHVSVDGAALDEVLCLQLLQTNRSSHSWIYPAALGVLFVLLLVYCLWLIYADEHDKKSAGLTFLYTFRRYKFLLQQLVSRDFKTKYKRSVLGVFWSFLNPLLTMAVQYIVFSQLFRFKVENYPVYLLTGIVFYNGFSEATTQAMSAIVGNASLITKVYVPKYIYPVSKVLSSTVNLLLSLIPLMLVALLTGVKPTLALLIVPFGIFFYILFIIGMSFALSAAMTFFRDMQFLWGVFTMMWMYATPIIYPMDTIKGTFLVGFQTINPLYHFISFFRTAIISGTSPEPVEYVICVFWAVLALAVGGMIFKKTQDQFVLHI